MNFGKRAVFSLATLVFSTCCFGDVSLPSIFSNGMVLQQTSNVAVWGWADPGEKVNVKGSGEWLWGRNAVADAEGKWMVRIPAPAAGGPYSLTVKGKNTIKLDDVLIGEVWICSGQSNMEMPLQGWPNQPVENSEEEIKNANYSNIRLFNVPKRTSFEPVYDCNAKWQVCSPESASIFSAAGYFFGREIHNNLDVPVGLINISFGASTAEAWMPEYVFENNEELKSILDIKDILVKRAQETKAKYKSDLEEWKAKEDKTAAGPKPVMPYIYYQCIANTLYNGMRLAVQPYTIQGIVWYQGEGNTDRPYQYYKLFNKMVENWREEWGQEEFPFYYVQIASFVRGDLHNKVTVEKGEPQEDGWAQLREAQRLSLSVPNTGMAVAIDIGEANIIHPRKKLEVGQRLAAWALAKTYGKDIVYSGPLYKSMKIEGDQIRISFDHVNDGLEFKGDSLEGFAIAGEDGKFVWAEAEIEGDTVIVSSPEISNPVAVRYGWAKFPTCNRFNKNGFPASPFSTDTLAKYTK